MSDLSNAPDTEDSLADAAAAGTLSVEQQLAELQARHTEVSDAYLRAKAEGENIRRRADEEISKARR